MLNILKKKQDISGYLELDAPIRKVATYKLFNKRYRLFFIGLVFRLLFLFPVLVLSHFLGANYMIYIWYPVCNCLLCIIVSNLNLILLTFRHYITVLLGYLFFTIIIKQLVQDSVFNIIIIIGFESIILLFIRIFYVRILLC